MFANTKDLKAAVKDFKAALRLDPDHPDASNYLEQTLARLDEEKQQRKSLKRGEFVMVRIAAYDSLMEARIVLYHWLLLYYLRQTKSTRKRSESLPLVALKRSIEMKGKIPERLSFSTQHRLSQEL